MRGKVHGLREPDRTLCGKKSGSAWVEGDYVEWLRLTDVIDEITCEACMRADNRRQMISYYKELNEGARSEIDSETRVRMLKQARKQRLFKGKVL